MAAEPEEQATTLYRMVDFMVDKLGYAFPAVSAHALRRATKRWHPKIPRPSLDASTVFKELCDEPDDAAFSMQLVAEARAVSSFLGDAAGTGRLGVCKAIYAAFPDIHNYFESWSPPIDVEVVCNAAEGGHVNVLQWAVDQGWPLHGDFPSAAKIAAQTGHADALQWAVEQGCPKPEAWISCSAAARGYLGVLQWFVLNGVALSEEHAREAAIDGQVHVLQWIHDSGFRRLHFAYYVAADNGNLAVAQWLHGAGYGAPPDEDVELSESLVTSKATLRGHVGVLRFLHSKGFPVCASYCSSTARRNRDLAVLQFLQENNLLVEEL
jgi:hypothetical protein